LLSAQQAEVANRIEMIRRQRYNRWSAQQIDYAIWGYNQKSSLLHPKNENKDLMDSTVSTLGEVDPILLEPVVLELYPTPLDEASAWIEKRPASSKKARTRSSPAWTL
jgi:hypothetical protein